MEKGLICESMNWACVVGFDAKLNIVIYNYAPRQGMGIP